MNKAGHVLVDARKYHDQCGGDIMIIVGDVQ